MPSSMARLPSRWSLQYTVPRKPRRHPYPASLAEVLVFGQLGATDDSLASLHARAARNSVQPRGQELPASREERACLSTRPRNRSGVKFVAFLLFFKLLCGRLDSWGWLGSCSWLRVLGYAARDGQCEATPRRAKAQSEGRRRTGVFNLEGTKRSSLNTYGLNTYCDNYVETRAHSASLTGRNVLVSGETYRWLVYTTGKAISY